MFSFLDATAPVWLSLAFSLDCDEEVTRGRVRQWGHDTSSQVTVAVCAPEGTARVSALLTTSETLIDTLFHDGDVLFVACRRMGAVIASGVFEVDCALGDADLLLIPRVTHNLILTQIRQEPTATTTTQPLTEQAVAHE
jgi:hypothetical protein